MSRLASRLTHTPRHVLAHRSALTVVMAMNTITSKIKLLAQS